MRVMRLTNRQIFTVGITWLYMINRKLVFDPSIDVPAMGHVLVNDKTH